MSEIQEKKNACEAAAAAEEKQQAQANAAKNAVDNAIDTYLQSAVHTAVLSEKLRRKKDSEIVLSVWLICFLAALVFYIFFGIAGAAAFAGLALLITWIVKDQTSDEKDRNYYNRKGFFSRYAFAVPADEQLPWKDGNIVYTGKREGKQGVWDCRHCGTINLGIDKFCTKCGKDRTAG